MSDRQNYFAILGLAPSYHLDARDLEERFHALSKLSHPDRHMKADGATRVRNALAASELNQAYRTLKDPVKRAEYLLQHHGIAVAAEGPGAQKVAPEFLMEMMEQRETLSDARAAGDRATVDGLARRIREQRDQAMAAIDDGFAALDGGDRNRLPAIAAALTQLRYYRRFLDEIEADEDARAEAALETR